MKNQFTDAMSKRTDADLQIIVTEQRNDFQPEAIEAAEQEIIERKLKREEFSKYSDEQLLEFLKSRKKNPSPDHHPYEVESAEGEAKKRNIQFDIGDENIETEINKEIQKLKTDVVRERYPALRFISGLYRLLAWLFAIATVIVFVYMLSQGQMDVLSGIGVLMGGGIIFVTLLAAAEGIQVFVDIEHNTRISATNSRK